MRGGSVAWMTNIHLDNSSKVSQSERRRWIHALWYASASHWDVVASPCLVCTSIESTFLLDAQTAKPQSWSMGPQSWTWSWANHNVMCLLRDPAVHQRLLHQGGQRDGLSVWRTSDTWRTQTGPEILKEGWWGWIDKREECCLYRKVSDDCMRDSVCAQQLHCLSSHVSHEFVCLSPVCMSLPGLFSSDWWIWLMTDEELWKWWNIW